jgi:hypothetical protein
MIRLDKISELRACRRSWVLQAVPGGGSQRKYFVPPQRNPAGEANPQRRRYREYGEQHPKLLPLAHQLAARAGHRNR